MRSLVIAVSSVLGALGSFVREEHFEGSQSVVVDAYGDATGNDGASLLLTKGATGANLNRREDEQSETVNAQVSAMGGITLPEDAAPAVFLQDSAADPNYENVIKFLEEMSTYDVLNYNSHEGDLIQHALWTANSMLMFLKPEKTTIAGNANYRHFLDMGLTNAPFLLEYLKEPTVARLEKVLVFGALFHDVTKACANANVMHEKKEKLVAEIAGPNFHSKKPHRIAGGALVKERTDELYEQERGHPCGEKPCNRKLFMMLFDHELFTRIAYTEEYVLPGITLSDALKQAEFNEFEIELMILLDEMHYPFGVDIMKPRGIKDATEKKEAATKLEYDTLEEEVIPYPEAKKAYEEVYPALERVKAAEKKLEKLEPDDEAYTEASEELEAARTQKDELEKRYAPEYGDKEPRLKKYMDAKKAHEEAEKKYTAAQEGYAKAPEKYYQRAAGALEKSSLKGERFGSLLTNNAFKDWFVLASTAMQQSDIRGAYHHEPQDTELLKAFLPELPLEEHPDWLARPWHHPQDFTETKQEEWRTLMNTYYSIEEEQVINANRLELFFEAEAKENDKMFGNTILYGTNLWLMGGFDLPKCTVAEELDRVFEYATSAHAPILEGA